MTINEEKTVVEVLDFQHQKNQQRISQRPFRDRGGTESLQNYIKRVLRYMFDHDLLSNEGIERL